MVENRRIFLLLGLFFLSYTGIRAQLNYSLELENAFNRYTKYVQENEITQIYRINVLITRDRREMESIKGKFQSQFPHHILEWTYEEPYYKLFTGKFLTEKEAWKSFYEIRKKYPETIIHIDRILPSEFFEN